MKCSEIADNLARSRRGWGQEVFLRREWDDEKREYVGRPLYCVIGLKLRGAGVSERYLKNITEVSRIEYLDASTRGQLIDLEWMNDDARNKKSLIEELRKTPDVELNIEAAIEAALKHQEELGYG